MEVILGLGLIIFVHELGHFTVAKLCGVRVEKFFLGFDVFGLKLFSFRGGETVYGIGILPLGGYVKMLGEEDSPAVRRSEMEQIERENRIGTAAECLSSEMIESAGNGTRLDPRSYMAKSVPQRMAIISAGVVMNMVFALIFAVASYLLGVREIPPVIGSVTAGSAAWQSGLLPDDTILDVAGRKVDNFTRVTEEIVNADLTRGIRLHVRRPGVAEPIEIMVKPEQVEGVPKIGVGPPAELKLVDDNSVPPVYPGSSAAVAEGPFLPGDQILQIDGKELKSFGDLEDSLAVHAGEDLNVTVARLREIGRSADGKKAPEFVNILVPKTPMKHFGLAMEMGPIAAIQVDSPAAKAGLRIGDRLELIDGHPISDPMRLPYLLRNKGGTEISLGIRRHGRMIERKVALSAAPHSFSSLMPDGPVAIPELGAAYYVQDIVAAVQPSSPAARAGIHKGDRLVEAKILPPSQQMLTELRVKYHDDDIAQNVATFAFADQSLDWPFFMNVLQESLPGTTVNFTWKREDKEMSANVEPYAAKDWYYSEPGWNLAIDSFLQKASSISEAVRLGWRETINSTLLVYRTLHSVVGTQQVSIRRLSGPLGIVKIALLAARSGLSTFLIFLTLISANLAAINFLPIPMLDGGHMMFLVYEGIRGKPADERVQRALTLVAFLFLISLMIFLFGLDLGFVSRLGTN
jgi:regulator of sigma E protease